MSSKTVVFALIAAIVLAVVFMAITQWNALSPKPGSGNATTFAIGDRLVNASASEITKITVGDGVPSDVVSRSEGSDAWTVQVGKTTWPADEARVRAALALITDARSVGAVDPQTELNTDPIPVVLKTAEGGRIELRMNRATLGGQGLVQVTAITGSQPDPKTGVPTSRISSKFAMVSDQLVKMFAPGSTKEWRRRTVLPGVSSTASRVRLVGGAGSVALGKVQGQWSVTEPVAGAADPKAIATLLGAFEALSIAKFFDEEVPTAVRESLESPQIRVIIDSDQRVMDGDKPGVKTTSTELRIGHAADPQGKTLTATMDGGATAFTIDTARTSSIVVDATRYLSGFASTVKSADVGELIITATTMGEGSTPATASTQAFKRTNDGWVEVRVASGSVAAGEVLQTKDRVEQIRGVLDFVSAFPCQSVKIETPAGYTLVGSITLKSPAGSLLDEMELGQAPGANVIVRSGGVYRGYSTLPALVTGLVPKLVSPVAAPGSGSGIDVNK